MDFRMKKVLIALMVSSVLTSSCDRNDDLPNINIRLKNVSEVEYKSVQLHGYAPYLEYTNIPPNETSPYRSYSSRLMPDTYFVITPNDTLNVIYEFVTVDGGLKNGFYTMELNMTELVSFNKD